MTPLAALAAAARDRLLAGAVVPIPGIGTLARAHVSARVHVGPDGARVLLPPGEAVGLSGVAGDPTDLATALVRHTGAAPETSAAALRDAVDQLEARLAITGEARLDGVGVFQRTSGGVRFAPDPDLLAAVNRPFEGLVPVAAALPAGGDEEERGGPASPDVEAPSAVAVAAEPSVAVAPDEPPGALDILLDLIVNEPAETPSEASSTPSPASPDIEPDGPEAPEAEGATEEGRGDVSPMESAFVDDDTLDDDLDTVLAVPFGLSDEAPELRDVLPPTPPDRDPGLAAEPDAAEPAEDPSDWPTETWTPRDEAPRPLDFADDDVEDADFLVVPPPAPSDDLPDDPSPLLDEEPPDVEAGAEDAYPAAPDGALGAFAASVSAGAEPPHTAFPEEPPRAYVNAGPGPETGTADADSERPARRGWAFLLLAVALALAALFLWRLLRADDPAPAPAAPSGATVAASDPAADTLAGRVAATDSASAEPGRPDTLAPPPNADAVAASEDATPATPSADTPAPEAVPGPAQAPPRPAAGGRRLGVAPDPRLALLPARVAGLPEADVRALTGGTVSVASGPWTWVVLSTPSRAEADGLAERYRTAGYRTAVLQASRNGRPSFRVVVGAFASREQAIRLRDRLPPQAPPDTWALDLRSP